MIERRLKTLILIFLWGALAEDTVLFVLSWLTPNLWFHLLHGSTGAGLEVALVRRAGGQWAAFALVQAIALWRWRTDPVWLGVAAGARFSDLFTDLSYLAAASSFTPLGRLLLLPPPVLNLVGVVILLRGYRQAKTQGTT